MDYSFLVGRRRFPHKVEQGLTKVVEQWLVHGAPRGLFDYVAVYKCALRHLQVRQLLLFASYLPEVLRCRCHHNVTTNRVRKFHWPGCLEERGLLIQLKCTLEIIAIKLYTVSIGSLIINIFYINLALRTGRDSDDPIWNELRRLQSLYIHPNSFRRWKRIREDR